MGVDIDRITVTYDERAVAVSSALFNGKSLDLILRRKISDTHLTQYGENGLILDLAKERMLKEYAPNCWKYLQLTKRLPDPKTIKCRLLSGQIFIPQGQRLCLLHI